MIGTVLDGRYRVLSKLGEGGMGEVYLVEQVNLFRKCALKILKARLATERKFVARFRREARAANRVQHPNIVGVYDFGQLPDGRFYLSMEYAQGESLDRILKRSGALPVPRVLHILHQLASAMDHAHTCGVVHRDLKPENLMLVEHRGHSDVLKVLDFGIAKIIAPEYNESLKLSQGGEIYGTAAYMAPEQAGNEHPDPRIDLYAFGCIAFELVVGEPPFKGRLVEIVQAHWDKIPDLPSARRPAAQFPPELDALVMRCLEKDPARRFQTGREVMTALERVPGFGSHKVTSAKRRLQTLHTAKLESSLYAEAASGTRAGWWGSSEPAQASSGDGQGEPLHAVLRDVIDMLLDLGHHDVDLLLSSVTLKELEDDLATLDAQSSAIDRQSEELEQSARERESTLRFSLGELAFERTQLRAQAGGETMLPQIEAQMHELEQRIARNGNQLQHELDALLDRSISLVSARADTEEKLNRFYQSIEPLVDGILPELSDRGLAVSLAQRLQRMRESVERR
jgi:serine/threonine protein kinase